MKISASLLVSSLLCCALMSPALADRKSDFLRAWNAEAGREVKLQAKDIAVRESDSELFPTLVVAGLRQSDGSFSLARVVWQGKSYTPLSSFGQILKDKNFGEMDDDGRRTTFLALLQETYGALGTKPYNGVASTRKDRPWPIVGLRGPDDSHRFQLWYYEFPVKKEEGEWREVLYTVTPDGGVVRARTLGSYYPKLERLRDFPAISPELFE